MDKISYWSKKSTVEQMCPFKLVIGIFDSFVLCLVFLILKEHTPRLVTLQ